VKRLPNWEKKLFDVIDNTQGFEWGQNDCCQFAARCVKAITGVNFAETFHYESECGANQYIAQSGDLTQLISNILGQPVGIKLLTRGDVVELQQNGRKIIGICCGGKSAFVTFTGLTWFDNEQCSHGWVI
jgi:hypothetical protein